MFSIYDQRKLSEIKDELGWKANVTKDDLVAVCMVLCDRIEALDNKIANQSSNRTKAG